jgi:hypothetical protein
MTLLAQDTQIAMNKGAAVSVATFIGVYGGPILTVLSVLYVSLQLYFLLRDKWYLPRKAKREQQEQEGRVQ